MIRTHRLGPSSVEKGDSWKEQSWAAAAEPNDAITNSPTTTNSSGINIRRKWKRTLRAGHPGVLNNLHVLGDRTRVSHAATVSVQTKKYFWALKCAGRSSELGKLVDMWWTKIKVLRLLCIWLSNSPGSPSPSCPHHLQAHLRAYHHPTHIPLTNLIFLAVNKPAIYTCNFFLCHPKFMVSL